MDSGLNVKDYEYIIFDSGSIIGVKGEQRHLISKEDWDRANPKHRDVGCKECKFVADKQSLLLYFVTRELRDSATKEPKFVGKFTMPDWTGHSGFYVFRCQECESVCVDYPHGYNQHGRIYLRCNDNSCRQTLVLEPRKARDIYEREKVVAPPERKENVEKQLREIVEQAGERGVRVITNGFRLQKPGWLKKILGLKS